MIGPYENILYVTGSYEILCMWQGPMKSSICDTTLWNVHMARRYVVFYMWQGLMKCSICEMFHTWRNPLKCSICHWTLLNILHLTGPYLYVTRSYTCICSMYDRTIWNYLYVTGSYEMFYMWKDHMKCSICDRLLWNDPYVTGIYEIFFMW